MTKEVIKYRIIKLSKKELIYLLDSIDRSMLISNKMNDCNRYCYLMHLQLKLNKQLNSIKAEESEELEKLKKSQIEEDY